jgi:hypothetical protein
MADQKPTFTTPWLTQRLQELRNIGTGLNVPANVIAGHRMLADAGQNFTNRMLNFFSAGQRGVQKEFPNNFYGNLSTNPTRMASAYTPGNPVANNAALSARPGATMAAMTGAPRPGDFLYGPKAPYNPVAAQARFDSFIASQPGAVKQANGDIVNYAPTSGKTDVSKIVVAPDTRTEMRNTRMALAANPELGTWTGPHY